MKVRVRDIHPEGLEMVEDIKADILAEFDQDFIKFIFPLILTVRFEKIDSTVLAKTHLKGKYSSACFRCLETVERDWQKNFYFDYEVTRETDYIEISDDVRQEMLVNLPNRVLCKEDCKGLCAGCGVNLNLETCKCKTKL